MLESSRLVAATTALIMVAGCVVRPIRPVKQESFILVSGSLTPQGVAAASTIADAHPGCLWVMAGDVAADRIWRELGGINFNVRLLTAAGVDAVGLTPDWFMEGPVQARSYVDACGFVPLCANITDVSGIPIGYPWTVRQCGPARVGLSAVWSAIDDQRLRQRGLELHPVTARARRVLPVLRGRAATTALLVVPPLAGAAAGYDFAIGDSTQRWAIGRVPGMDTVVFLTCRTDVNGAVESFSQQTLSLANVEMKTDIKATADSLRRLVDSTASAVITVVANTLSAAAATQRIARRIILESGADCLVCDAPLVSDGIAAGPLTIGRILEILGETGPCAIVEATGAELRRLLADARLQCVWRSNAPRPVVVASRTYRVAMTSGFLGRHQWVPPERQERLSFPLWRCAAEAMGTRQE